MRTNFAGSCETCVNMSTCTLAVETGTRLEKAAAELGCTVIEGEVGCPGRESYRPQWAACGADIHPPILTSQQELDRAKELISLVEQAEGLTSFTKGMIRRGNGERGGSGGN